MKKYIPFTSRTRSLCAIVLLLLVSHLQAQQVPLINQYFNNPTVLYPSSAALSNESQVSLMYRQQFSGLQGAPSNLVFGYAGKIKQRLGLGFNANRSSLGLLNQTRLQGAFSYSLWNEGQHKIALGVAAGVSLFSLDQNVLNPEAINDPVLQNLLGNNGSALSADIGVSYRFKDFQFDLTVPNVINESISNDEFVQINQDNVPNLLTTVGYRFMLNLQKQIYLSTYATMRYREVIGVEMDLIGKVDIGKKFNVFGGYRGNFGSSVGAGFMIKPNIQLVYSHDFGQSDVPFLSDGFSEFGIHFSFKSRESKAAERLKAGEEALQKLEDENTYDINLVSDEDVELIREYLTSKETKGNKKQKQKKADSKFLKFLSDLKQKEIERFQAEAASASAEKAVARVESGPLVVGPEVEEVQETENSTAHTEVKTAAQQAEPQIQALETDETEKLEDTASGTLPSGEQPAETTPVQLNSMDFDDKDFSVRAISDSASHIPDKDLENGAFILVVSANKVSAWATLYVSQLKARFPGTRTYYNAKTDFLYVYISTYSDLNGALGKLKKMREQKEFADAWLHKVKR